MVVRIVRLPNTMLRTVCVQTNTCLCPQGGNSFWAGEVREVVAEAYVAECSPLITLWNDGVGTTGLSIKHHTSSDYLYLYLSRWRALVYGDGDERLRLHRPQIFVSTQVGAGAHVYLCVHARVGACVHRWPVFYKL